MNEPIRKIFATEEALMDSIDEGPFLILYRSKPHSVSISYNQSLNDLDIDRCTMLGADFSRRETGGRAVYHSHLTDMSYAIIAPKKPFMKEIVTIDEDGKEIKKLYPDVRKAYNYFCDVVVRALAHIGLEARIDDSNFVNVRCHDGKFRKISGSAQWWPSDKEAVLQHGYILFDKPTFGTGYKMIKHAKSAEKRHEEAVAVSTAVSEHRPGADFSMVVDGFLETLPCKPMFLKSYQIKKIEELLHSKYNNHDWQTGKHLSIMKEKGDCVRGEQFESLGAHIE